MNPRDPRPLRSVGRHQWIRPLLSVVGCAGLIAGAGSLIAASSASAAGNQCATSAKIVARTGHGFVMWNGKETKGVATKFTGTVLTYGSHFYELHNEGVKITFGGDTYTLGGNAVFDLGCSGLAVGQRAIEPRINMLRGSATVKTTHAHEGSVSTEEGLYGQVPQSAAMSYFVVRQLHQRSALSLQEKVNWFEDYANQPIGMTNVKTLTSVLENVTPYVGTKIGRCRHVHSAKLVTTSSWGHGTAVYHF